jgi:hypothetical protein
MTGSSFRAGHPKNVYMSKPRIAAWIAGSALLLSSGVALAQEAQPEDPTVDETELVESTVVDENLEVEDDTDLEKSDEQVVEAAETGDLDEGEESSEENHGSVVSQAAKNHEFDEACGNHGAYVSEVARGGDPDDPECAKEDVVEDEVETETHESSTEKPGKSSDAKGKAKASGSKAAKRGK